MSPSVNLSLRPWQLRATVHPFESISYFNLAAKKIKKLMLGMLCLGDSRDATSDGGFQILLMACGAPTPGLGAYYGKGREGQPMARPCAFGYAVTPGTLYRTPENAWAVGRVVGRKRADDRRRKNTANKPLLKDNNRSTIPNLSVFVLALIYSDLSSPW
jgi:hypothetical protein